MEEDGAGHGRTPVPGQHDKPSITGQDMPLDAFEETKRLGRKAMLLSRLALQAVERAYGIQILRDSHSDSALVTLPDRAPHGSIDVREQDILVIGKAKSVAVVTGRSRCARPERFPATAFHVFPVPRLGVPPGFVKEAMERCGGRT
jgi:hypothetical protein